jgi:NitT/TauT family transport system ATP-binding protein
LAVSLGLEVAEVSKGFDTREGRVLVLDSISLSVERGQFVSVIGPTGCGKSTLLRIVAGLLEADAGSISIFGESPADATAKKHVGFVPQSPALLPWRSVLDNVRLPFQVNRKARVATSADCAIPASGTSASNGHRDPVAVLESFGLGAVLDRKPRQLSMGMQQRVAIARAFVFDPSILVMDEPFSALDELTREQQRHELLAMWQSNRKTVLFVTHSVPEAVVLSDAVLVMSGPPGRVRAVVPVDLPRPRSELVEATEVFHEIEGRIRSALRESWHERGG